MQVGMVGLGKMGANMVRRLMAGGHSCVGFDVNLDNVEKLKTEGADGAFNLADFVSKLQAPRIVWCMVPAGDLTESTVMAVAELLESGDIIVDGGNSFYKDDGRTGCPE